jgi:serine phosphatase RsbU (regulator of sigma subunit)
MDTSLNLSAGLFVETGGMRRFVPIAAIPFTIGRSADRNLLLNHPQVSREHACIERDVDGYLLRDLGSRHGTFVNGTRISNAHLHSGDSITLGAGCNVLVFENNEGGSTRTLMAQLSQNGSNASGPTDLEKLTLFLKAAQSLGAVGALNDVLCTMLEYTIRLTGAERGFVFLGEKAETFQLKCGQDQHGTPIRDQPAISYSVVRDAAASQLDFIISDITDELAQGRDSLIMNAIGSVVAIPLRCENSEQLLGLLYLDSHSGRRDFTRTSKEILHAIAHQAATLLENMRLLEMERESALMRKELEIAASIQRQIIPQTLPEFPYVHLSARTVPCAGVGGDFYDVIPLPSGFVAIVADVCGKGVPAALLASMVQGMLHGQVDFKAARQTSLAEAVQSVNSFVCSRTAKEKYVTMAVLRYTHSDSGDAEVELVNGGHIAPLIVRADGRVESIGEGDLPVGLFDFAQFHVIPTTLGIGDRIVLLSDGITEAENMEGDEFGLAQVERHVTHPDTVGSLFEAMECFCRGTRPQDDRTVLTIQRVA